jgi:hypothetical protein
MGLTPAGDDFLMGAIYAGRILHPSGMAETIGRVIAAAAKPMTTALSGAWLQAASRGELGEKWHELFDALLSQDIPAIHRSINRVLAVGHTSGADALAGFLAVLAASQRRSKGNARGQVAPAYSLSNSKSSIPLG